MDLINGQILQFFEWDPKNDFKFFTPRTWAYFNSYDVEELESIDSPYYTLVDLK